MDLLIPVALIVFGLASATIEKAYRVHQSASPGLLQTLITYLWFTLTMFTAGLIVHLIRDISHGLLFLGFDLIYVEYVFYLLFYAILLYSVFHLYHLYCALGFEEQVKHMNEAIREREAL